MQSLFLWGAYLSRIHRGSYGVASLILYNWLNSLTLAQTDHQHAILKKSCL
jgi:hypothetical protein